MLTPHLQGHVVLASLADQDVLAIDVSISQLNCQELVLISIGWVNRAVGRVTA